MTSRTKQILKLVAAQHTGRLSPEDETYQRPSEPDIPKNNECLTASDKSCSTSKLQLIDKLTEQEPDIPKLAGAQHNADPLSPEAQPEVRVDQHPVDPRPSEVEVISPVLDASLSTSNLQQIYSATSQPEAPNKHPSSLYTDCQPSTSRAKSPVLRQTSRIRKPPVILTNEYVLSSDESDPFADSGSSYIASDGELENNESESHSDIEDENEQEEQETTQVLDDDLDAANTDKVIQDTWGPCTDFPIRFQYSVQNAGIQVNDLDLSNPYKIFRQFLTDEILDIIVVETNRYALQYISSHQLRPRSLLKKWSDTNRDEIKKFIAILMIMGIVHLPKLRLYWSSTEKFGSVLVQKIMKRDRFECLLKCLHFSNNEVTTSDRLFKIRNVLELICKQFQRTLVPGENLVIDESMVPWRGRLVFRQYLPAKAHKYGIKLYKICTPDAFTYDLRVYVGKNEVNENRSNHGHSYDVCLQLMEKLLGEGRTLFIDNFYTSVQLCKDLLDKNTYVCGTLRTNRKRNPKSVTLKKIKKGEIYGEQNEDGIKVIKWIDKRQVLMISTVPSHSDKLIPTGRKNRKGEEILKPSPVIDYNKAKKGVDMSDQMSSYYTPLRKTIKWYRKVFCEVALGTAVVNTWSLHNNFGNPRKKLDMLQTTDIIIMGLIGTDEVIDDNTSSQGDTEEPPRKKIKKSAHRMMKYEGLVRNTRKRCSSCYQKIKNDRGLKEAKLKTKRVNTYCEDCPSKPTYCLDCFNQNHK